MLNAQDTQWLYHFLAFKTGIPVTPYKECMIDGSESPNAS